MVIFGRDRFFIYDNFLVSIRYYTVSGVHSLENEEMNRRRTWCSNDYFFNHRLEQQVIINMKKKLLVFFLQHTVLLLASLLASHLFTYAFSFQHHGVDIFSHIWPPCRGSFHFFFIWVFQHIWVFDLFSVYVFDLFSVSVSLFFYHIKFSFRFQSHPYFFSFSKQYPILHNQYPDIHIIDIVCHHILSNYFNFIFWFFVHHHVDLVVSHRQRQKLCHIFHISLFEQQYLCSSNIISGMFHVICNTKKVSIHQKRHQLNVAYRNVFVHPFMT